MRFRTKTILGIAIIESVLLAVLIMSVLSILRESNESELTQRVQLGARLLAAAAKDAVLAQDLDTLESLVSETMASGQIDMVRIVDASGRTLAERGDNALLVRPFAQDKGIANLPDGIFDWSSPIEVGGVRTGEVRIGVSTAPLGILLSGARRWAAFIAGIELLLVALFSWLLGNYLVRQLEALRRASVLFGAGDFAHRVPVHGSDELAQTAIAFNRMVSQLSEGRLELQAALERVRDRNQQLDAIFSLSPDGFVSFDSKRRVKYANAAFLRLTGFVEADVLGLEEPEFSKRLSQRCIDAAPFAGMVALRTAAAAKVDFNGISVGTKSGEKRRPLIEMAGAGKRVIEVAIRLSDAPTVSQILYLRDVTRETEVDRMKSEFLSTAAHELRTPMVGILGFSELMLAQQFSTEEQREFLGIIHRQSLLIVGIINELLDLARIEARRGADFSIQPLETRQLVADVVASFKTPDGREPPQVKTFTGPCWVKGDSNKLAQTLVNVLSNAYKYSPQGGSVEVELVNENDRVGIRVLDHGIGLNSEQIARVGERFYRADTSGKIPGTGLGMSIVQEIMEYHGGRVFIDSKVGSGTAVTLWLPAFAAVT